MANTSGAIRAGRAFVEMFLDKSALEKGLKQASARLKSWGSSIASVGKGFSSIGTKFGLLGTSIVAPLAASAKAAGESGASLLEMSHRTGIAVERLSALGFAADMTGTDLETVEGGVRRMQRSITKFADGAMGASKPFDRLGISLASIKDKNPADQFEMIAEKISEIPDPSERAAAAMSIFGKTGTSLIPMMDRLGELQQKAKDFGFIKSAKSAKEAKEFSDTLLILEKVFKGIFTALGTAVIPIIERQTKIMINAALTARQWIRENQGLIDVAFKVGKALVVGGSALYFFGKALQLVSPLSTILSTGLGLVFSTLSFLLSPLGLVVAGLAGLGIYFLTSTEAGHKFINSMSGMFGTLKEDAIGAFQGIADALIAGDIGLAVKVLWSVVKLEWARGLSALENSGVALVNILINAFNKLIDVINVVRSAWRTTQQKVMQAEQERVAIADKEAAKKEVMDKYYKPSDWNFLHTGRNISEGAAITRGYEEKLAKLKEKYGGKESPEFLAEKQALSEETKNDINKMLSINDKLKSELNQAAEDAKKAFPDIKPIGPLGNIKPADTRDLEKDVVDAQRELEDKAFSAARAKWRADQAAKSKEVTDILDEFNDATKNMNLRLSREALEADRLSKISSLGLSDKLQSAGSFNASIANRLAPGESIDAKQLKEMEKMNSKLAEIAGNTDDLGEEFAN